MHKKIKNFSFHPRLAMGLDLLFGIIMIWWFLKISLWWMVLVWVFVRLIWWGVLSRFVYYSKNVDRPIHFFSLFIFHLGSLGWLLFNDKDITTWYAILALVAFFPSISFFLLPLTHNRLSFVIKPQRRFCLLLSALGIAGIWSAVAASITFNIFRFPLFTMVLFASLITLVTSILWWKNYGYNDKQALTLWTLIMGIFLFEFGYILLLWPIHFFFIGFLISWFWYVCWLIIRFHLSTEGIQWRRQIIFLLTNIVCMIIFLSVFIKWK